ncbi:MAG: hypothetical protein KAG66_15430, partial [Methylococcales bacterium]|nr:hypothetical protein [Methylococcales bacterium]
QPSQAEVALTSASTSGLTEAFEITLAQFEQSETAKLEAHETFLQFSQNLTQSYSDILQWQMSLLGSLPTGAKIEGSPVGLSLNPTEKVRQSPVSHAATTNQAWIPNAPPREQRAPFSTMPVALNRSQCMEFAIGKIGNVLGAEFAPIDAYPTRVRLPDEPLMLVDRILSIEGEPRSMSHGRVVTEHDIHVDAWYLDAGVIPTCVAVEAGQADLFLAGYLGIDFESKGLAVYRLLDAVVTFHRQLPESGEVIHYDIHIERFFRQGDTYLFRFNFEATVDGVPLLSMSDGCAGFFTQAELDGGKGIVHTQLDLQPQPKALPTDWEVFVPMVEASYHASEVEALRMGDLLGCFGELFAGLPIHDPVGLPSGKMSLVDRVLHLDPSGGKYGLGAIRAEADI